MTFTIIKLNKGLRSFYQEIMMLKYEHEKWNKKESEHRESKRGHTCECDHSEHEWEHDEDHDCNCGC